MARNCRIDTDLAELKGAVSPEELDGLYAQAEAIVSDARTKGLDPVAALEEAKASYVNKIRVSKSAQLATALKTKTLVEKLGEVTGDDAYKKLDSLFLPPTKSSDAMGEVPLRFKKESNFSRSMTVISQKLDEIEGAQKILSSGVEDLNIRKLMKGEKVDGASPQVRQIAEVLKKAMDRSFEAKRAAGFDVMYLKGRVVRQTHSAKGMMDLGKQKYIDLGLKTFDFDGDSHMFTKAERVKFLSDFYDKTTKRGTSNFKIADDFSAVTKDTSSRFEAERKISFKDTEAEHLYNTTVNKKTLMTQIADELSTDSGKLAAADTFGPAYAAGLEKVLSSADISPTQRNILKSKFNGIVNNGWDSGDSAMATVGKNIRKATDVISLNRSIISTITDHGFTAGVLSAFSGDNIISTSYKSLTNFFRMVPKQNRKEVAQKLHLYMSELVTDSHSTRFGGEIDNVQGLASSMHRGYMSLLGLNAQSQAARLNAAMLFSGSMADNASKNFDQLPKQMSGLLERYGIGAEDWDMIKSAKSKYSNGMEGITVEDIAAVHGEGAKSVELQTKLQAVYQTVAEFGSPTATEKQTFFKGMVDPNTAFGQMSHFLMQYKLFSFASLDTMKAIKGADNSAARSWGTLGATMATTTGWGLVAIMAKDIADGKKPREITGKTMAEAMMQGGAFGPLGDILAKDYNDNFASLGADIAGPSFRTVQTALGAAHSLKDLAVAAASHNDAGVRKAANTTLKNFMKLSPKAPIIGNIIQREMLEAIQRSANLPVSKSVKGEKLWQ